MRALLNTMITEGTPVHDLKMITHLNELEFLGAKIDGKTLVNIVLMLLPESFKNFCFNYSMSKMPYTLAELLKELQATEGIVGHKGNVQVMEKYLLLQRRVKRRTMFQCRLHNLKSRNPRLVKASRKASASLVVRRVTGIMIDQRNLTLRTTIPQVCLLL